jgi:hypothetical protein
MRRFALLLFCSILLISVDGMAQRKGDSTNKVTPSSARKKDADALDQKQNEYQQRKNHHLESQDKATRKRMKKNLRKARKHSWGKDIPWYKRWFRKQ